MPQAWLARLGLAVADALGLADLAKTIASVILALIVFALLAIISVMLAPFALLGGTGNGGGGAASVPADLGFWATGLLTQEANAVGVPPVIALAVMDHESSGQWTATGHNPDGSVDAGLMQINSRNWSHYGLNGNPYDPAGNIQGGLTILAGYLSKHPDDVAAGLEAYNAGTAERGQRYDPGYASAVLADAKAIEAGPHLAVAQFGGGALPVAGAGRQAVLVTAFAPFGPATTAYSQSWPGLVAPDSLTATAGGQAVDLTPCDQAPDVIQHLLPPDASCFVAIAAAGQPVTVTATWHKTTTTTWTDAQGHTHTETTRTPVTVTEAAQ